MVSMRETRIHGSRFATSIGLLIFGMALLGRAGIASAQTFTEYPIPTTGSSPAEITTGPDGALWFTEQSGNNIGRISTSGTITEYPVTTANAGPAGIVTGPDGNLWFTENTANKIGKITTAGVITEYTIPTANSQPIAITVGSHGGIWFVEQGGNNIGKISPTDGTFTEYPIPTANSQPQGIRPGSDGALWFTEVGSNKIGRITGAGAITEFTNPNSAAALRFITPAPDGKLLFTEAQTDQIGAIDTTGSFKGDANPPSSSPGVGYIGLGPDGAVWFPEQQTNKIGRVSSNGFGGGNVAFQEYSIPTASSVPQTLTAGPDGNLWFTEQSGNKIGKFVLPASTTPMVAAVLPASRSIVSGNTATAFATMINGGSTALTNCGIVPLSNTPETFSYQTTNSATNAVTGTVNTQVALAGGQSQSFVITMTANTTFVPNTVFLSFYCKSVDPAVPVNGLNTLLLSSSTTATPDVIALGATPSGDGILGITGTSGTGAFAVATANVGAAGTITASVDTGAATGVPLTLTICQSNPTTAVCTNPSTPAATATLTVNANDTPTFSVFATASGAVTFAPATTRIFVRFKDSGGATRGSTSVAVRTQ
jgi:streptogramin lyase